jgi:CubicO group peptidase (beta-lactamase class C family)
LALIGDAGVRAPGLEFEQFNTEPVLTAVSPGNTCRGPARELARVFEVLANGGARGDRRILQPTTAEAVVACHRRGLVDQTFAANNKRPHPRWGLESPWGLGVELDGNADIGTLHSPRVFASSGAFSSVGFGDPATGLVGVIVTTGLLDLDQNAARLSAVADAMNMAIDR